MYMQPDRLALELRFPQVHDIIDSKRARKRPFNIYDDILAASCIASYEYYMTSRSDLLETVYL